MEKESNKETLYLLVKGRNVYKQNKNKAEKGVETCINNQIYCYFKKDLNRAKNSIVLILKVLYFHIK